MSSSSLDCEEAFEEGKEFIFILPVPPDLPPPPTTESSSLDLIETLLVIFLLKANKHENKEASDDDNATSVDDEDLPPPPEPTEPPIESLTPDSDLLNGNLSMDNLISEVKYPMLPRDVIDNAAPFPMVNQIDKEFKDLTFEEKKQLFFQSQKKQGFTKNNLKIYSGFINEEQNEQVKKVDAD